MRNCFLTVMLTALVATSSFGQTAQSQKLERQSEPVVAQAPAIYFGETAVRLGDVKSKLIADLSQKFEVSKADKHRCVAIEEEDCWLVYSQPLGRYVASAGFTNDKLTHLRHTLVPSIESAGEVVWNLSRFLPDTSTCTVRNFVFASSMEQKNYVVWTCNGVKIRLGAITGEGLGGEPVTLVELVEMIGEVDLHQWRN